MDVILKNVSVGNLNALRVSVEYCIHQLESSVFEISEDFKSSVSNKKFLAEMLSDRKSELKEFKEILK